MNCFGWNFHFWDVAELKRKNVFYVPVDIDLFSNAIWSFELDDL